MRRRTFIQLSATTAVGSYFVHKLAWIPYQKVYLYHDIEFTPKSSILFKQIEKILALYNERSSVKIQIVGVPPATHLPFDVSFISAPDNFNFQKTVTAGYDKFTFLGPSKTYDAKINDVLALEKKYTDFMERVGFSPIFLGVGPDLQVDIIKVREVKKFAVYDAKSYLFSKAINADPVRIAGTLDQYFGSFHNHFDATAPLYFQEFYGDKGFKISKELVKLDHLLSPTLFTAYFSMQDVVLLGDKNLRSLNQLAHDHIKHFSKQISDIVLKKLII